MKFNKFSARKQGNSNQQSGLPRPFISDPLSLVRFLLSLFLIFLTPVIACLADNFTTGIQEYTTQTWSDAIWQPGPASPTAGNSYEVLNGGIIQTPPSSGFLTFPGDSLTLDGDAKIVATTASIGTLNFPGVNGNPGLILNGGNLSDARQPGNLTFTIAGWISVVAPSTISHPWGTGGFVITAELSGTGNLTVFAGAHADPLDIQSQNNSYSGQWVVRSGYLKGSGQGSLGTGNVIVFAGSTFEVNYDIQTPGALTMLGANSMMVLHQDCRFSAVSINGMDLTPGTYTYNSLLAQFPGTFAPGGSGSITVGLAPSVSVFPPPTLPGYYVDYVGGSDSNVGTSPSSAWQHCPGDPSATGKAGSTPLNPGDTVFFKGGVSYVLTATSFETGLPVGWIQLNWSGTAGYPITYDGNSAGTWGVGDAILLGSGTNFVLGFDPVKGASNIAFTHSIFVGPVGEAQANGSSYVCQFAPSVSNGLAATDTYIEQTNTDGSAIMYNGNPWFKGASNGFSLAYELVTNSLGTNMYVIEAGSPPSPTNTVLFYTQRD